MHIMRPSLPQAGSWPVRNQPKTAHIIVPEEWWIMTYRGAVCMIKDTHNYADDRHRYRRNGWTGETVARSTARRMNELFHTEDFGVRQIAGGDHGRS